MINLVDLSSKKIQNEASVDTQLHQNEASLRIILPRMQVLVNYIRIEIGVIRDKRVKER